MSISKLYSWKRLWIPIGSNYYHDNDGFPNFNSYDAQTGQVKSSAKSLSGLENDKCLILIGDPGIGKTTEIEIIKHDAAGFTKKYLLRDYATTSELFADLEKGLSLVIDSNFPLFLYFDGLDEGLLNINKLNTSITKWLNDLRHAQPDLFNKIHFRITCRSVTWSEISISTSARLREVFGEESIKIVELAPLRQEDVRQALEQEGLQAAEFIKLVKEAQLQGFCLDPQSLSALIKCFHDGRLSRGIQRKELFEEMILNKCIEFNEEHKGQKQLTPEQRFKIASRIAAYCILSNKTTIWVDEERESAIDNDLIIDELVRDQFKINTKTELVKSKNGLLEILDTALFSSGNNKSRFLFKHRGELEFLAAWHFDKIELHQNQIIQLLTSHNDPGRSVPQIQEVIIWLSTLNSKVFELLSSSEPILLLRCRREFSELEKRSLVKSLLQNADSFNVVDSYEDEKYYRKLNSKGIAKQIKPYFHKKGNTAIQRICIQISQACCLKSLQVELFKVLNDKSNSTHIRKQAIEAIASFQDERVLLRLVDFATEERNEDIDDEVKGAALKALYPGTLSTTKMLECLTPIKRNNLYGSYKSFLDTLDALIPDSDVGLTLSFISELDSEFIRSNSIGPFERLRLKMIERSYTQLKEQNILRLVSESVKTCLINHFQFPRPIEANDRRVLAQAIIENWNDSMRSHLLTSAYSNQLIEPDDWQWLINLFTTIKEKKIKILLVEILIQIIDRGDAKKVNELLEIALTFEDFKSNKFMFGPIDLDSKDAEDLRSIYQKPNQDATRVEEIEGWEVQNSIQKLRAQILKIESGEFEEWWRLIYIFSEGMDFEFDITQHKHWSDFGEENQIKLILFAKNFVKSYPPNPHWIFTTEYDRRELSGYCAIVFLKKFESEFIETLSEEFWNNWLSIIIHCSLNDSKNELDVDQKFILLKCYSQTAGLFKKDLIAQIEHLLKYKKRPYDINKIKFIFDPSFGQDLLSLMIKSSFEDSEYLLDLLFQCCPELSKKFAWKNTRLFFEGNPELKNEKLAVQCGAKLFQYLQSADWEDYWSLIIKDNDKAKRIFLFSIAGSDSTYRSQLNLLNPNQRADLLSWVISNFPKEEDPNHNSTYSPASRDYVVMFRSELVRSLIEEGSVDSVMSLRRVSEIFSNIEDLKWWVNSSREFMRRNTWVPASPAQLRALFFDYDKRLIRNENELSEIILESLSRLEKKLQGNNPTAYFLWDKTEKGFTPKDENSLSDFVKMHLDYDLIERSIVVNREVEIRKSTGKKDGERTDLYVQAISYDSKQTTLSLVIETKKCNHSDVDNAMELQLKKRYLKKHKCSYGIYLVGWYYGNHLRSPKGKGKESFDKKLKEQANILSDNKVQLKSVVLDCSN